MPWKQYGFYQSCCHSRNEIASHWNPPTRCLGESFAKERLKRNQEELMLILYYFVATTGWSKIYKLTNTLQCWSLITFTTFVAARLVEIFTKSEISKISDILDFSENDCCNCHASFPYLIAMNGMQSPPKAHEAMTNICLRQAIWNKRRIRQQLW